MTLPDISGGLRHSAPRHVDLADENFLRSVLIDAADAGRLHDRLVPGQPIRILDIISDAYYVMYNRRRAVPSAISLSLFTTDLTLLIQNHSVCPHDLYTDDTHIPFFQWRH